MTKTKDFLIKVTKNNSLCFWCILFIAFILKYLIYGFNYFPVLDDYIQYGGYPMYNDISFVLFDIGTASARPLAAFLDVAFWGSLWNIPHLMLIFSCAFHFFSCVFFYKALEENNIKLSPIFAVFYLFFPLGSEGSFWISASSRIVVGLFFTSIAIFLLTKYLKNRKSTYFILFFLTTLCAFALYEPCAVFCFLLSCVILFINRKEKRLILPALSLILSLIALLIYTKLGANIGRMGSRASSSSILLIFTQSKDFFIQLFEILTKGVYDITIKGFTEGLKVIFHQGITGIIYIVAIFSVCILSGKCFSDTKIKTISKADIILRIFMGFILFTAPFVPNMMSEYVWITYRTMFIPLVGMYIIFDTIFTLIPHKSLQTILLMTFMFIFIVASVNEYDTYKRTNELDRKLLDRICEELPESVINGEQEAAVLLDTPPSVHQVSYYKDHVKCAFHEDWALTGAVRAHKRAITIKKVTPVYPDTEFDYSECFVIDLRDITKSN